MCLASQGPLHVSDVEQVTSGPGSPVRLIAVEISVQVTRWDEESPKDVNCPNNLGRSQKIYWLIFFSEYNKLPI